MGVDITKQKKKQKEEEAKGKRFQTTLFWAPKQGANAIRIMPPWTEEGHNANDFAREVSQHWLTLEGGARRPFTCPARTPDVDDDVCEICDYKNALLSSGNPEDAEAAEAFYGKTKYLSNIVDLSDPVWTAEDLEDVDDDDISEGDVKVQVYRYGPQVYKQLLDLFAMLEMDLTDLETGTDIIVSKKGKGKMGTSYTVVQKAASPFQVNDKQVTVEDLRLSDLDALDAPRDHSEMRQALPNAKPAATTAPPSLPPVDAEPAALPNPPPSSVDDLEREMQEAIGNS